MNKSPKNVNRAKKLFFEYLGNSFLMRHDGVEEDYRSFSISKAQESMWYEELKAELVAELLDGDYSVVSKLEQMGAQDVLSKILAISPKGDSWTKLRFAEDLWHFTEITTDYPVESTIIRQAREKAMEIWQSLLSTVTDPTIPDEVIKIAAKGRNPRQYFRDRLKLNLKKASDSV